MKPLETKEPRLLSWSGSGYLNQEGLAVSLVDAGAEIDRLQRRVVELEALLSDERTLRGIDQRTADKSLEYAAEQRKRAEYLEEELRNVCESLRMRTGLEEFNATQAAIERKRAEEAETEIARREASWVEELRHLEANQAAAIEKTRQEALEEAALEAEKTGEMLEAMGANAGHGDSHARNIRALKLVESRS